MQVCKEHCLPTDSRWVSRSEVEVAIGLGFLDEMGVRTKIA